MEIIIRPRQAGKTTEVLRLAARHFGIIVVPTQADVDRLWSMARGWQLEIPKPITWEQFVRGDYLRGFRGINGRTIDAVVIDDLDRCLQHMARTVPVAGFSVSDGGTDTTVRVGDFDRYGRLHARVMVDGQPWTGWLEPAGTV